MLSFVEVWLLFSLIYKKCFIIPVAISSHCVCCLVLFFKCANVLIVYVVKGINEHLHITSMPFIQGPAQITPTFYYKIFHNKIISMLFCNTTISHSRTPYDILGEMLKCCPSRERYSHTIPTTLKTRYFCQTLNMGSPFASKDYWLRFIFLVSHVFAFVWCLAFQTLLLSQWLMSIVCNS